MKFLKKYVLPPVLVIGTTYMLNSIFVFGPSGYIAREMTKRQIQSLDTKIKRLERENARLKAKLRDLKEGKDISLRDYGFIKEGEKIYSFIVVGENQNQGEEKSTLMGKAILLSGAMFLIAVVFTVAVLSI